MDKSIIEQAIEAIEKMKQFQPTGPVRHVALSDAIMVLKRLLPKEEEQRKEIAREAWFAYFNSGKDFDTWYNTINEKG